MYKFLLIILISLSAFLAKAQTVTGDRFVARQGVYVKDRWVESVTNDTTDMMNQRAIMTNDAVRRYVQARIATIPVTPYMDSMWRRNDSIFWSKRGVTLNLGRFQPYGDYFVSQYAAAQVASGWITGRFRAGGLITGDSGINVGSWITNPTAINGRIGYNSTANQFVGVRNGSWGNLLMDRDSAIFLRNSTSIQTGNFAVTGNGEIDGVLRLYGPNPAIYFYSPDVNYALLRSGSTMQLSSTGPINLKGSSVLISNTGGTNNAAFVNAQLRIGTSSFDGTEVLKVFDARVNALQAWDIGSGTDIGGTTLKLLGGRPNGTGFGGRIEFYTSPQGTVSGTGRTDGILRMFIRYNGIVNIQNAPIYADDASASAGGLVAGDVYKTSTGQLMIKL